MAGGDNFWTSGSTAGGGAASTVLGYAENASLSQNVTSEADITGLSVTVSVTSGHRVRVSAQVNAYSDGASQFIVYIKEGATYLNRIGQTNLPTQGALFHGAAIITPTAGSHTYNVRAARTSGTATCTVDGGSGNRAWILVEDLGEV